VVCGGEGISDAFYCFECTRLEKDRDGCPKIINLGSSRVSSLSAAAISCTVLTRDLDGLILSKKEFQEPLGWFEAGCSHQRLCLAA
jgi:hypothetical protein